VNLGLVFTANTNFSVTALGFYFTSDDTASEIVALYDSARNLLVATSVLLSDPNVAGYLFQKIPEVALSAGSQYTVVAYTGFNDWSYGSTPPNQAGAVTYNFHDAAYSSSLTFPTDTNRAAGGPNGTYYGPYRSDRWKVRAEETKRLAGYQCQYFGLSCQGTINLECHHVTYRNEFRETPGFDLICVCRNCHQQIHRLRAANDNFPRAKVREP
jgi:hypothetical protein